MNSALFVVDVQHNMVEGPWSVPDSEGFLAKFADRIDQARKAEWLVVFVQNDGPEGDVDEPGCEGWQLWFEPREGDRVVRKTTQNVFESNPDLSQQLKDADIDTIELVGMQSEYCVQASARGAKAAGFSVLLQPQLHATFHDGTPATNQPGASYEISATDLAAQVHASLVADGTLT